jgi:MFS superfamily sulfate permease-like transporter
LSKLVLLGDYVPTSVIKGMLSAIGIILILKQIPHLVGYDADFVGDETFLQRDNENTFSGIFSSFSKLTALAVIIGFISLAIQILWDKVLVKKGKFFKLVPAPLVVVIAGVVINSMSLSGYIPFGLQKEQLVNIPSAENLMALFHFLPCQGLNI